MPAFISPRAGGCRARSCRRTRSPSFNNSCSGIRMTRALRASRNSHAAEANSHLARHHGHLGLEARQSATERSSSTTVRLLVPPTPPAPKSTSMSRSWRMPQPIRSRVEKTADQHADDLDYFGVFAVIGLFAPIRATSRRVGATAARRVKLIPGPRSPPTLPLPVHRHTLLACPPHYRKARAQFLATAGDEQPSAGGAVHAHAELEDPLRSSERVISQQITTKAGESIRQARALVDGPPVPMAQSRAQRRKPNRASLAQTGCSAVIDTSAPIRPLARHYRPRRRHHPRADRDQGHRPLARTCS